jgi:hypothetical protein
VAKSGGGGGPGLVAIVRPRDRRHEAVAPPGQRRDVTCAVLSVAERLAQAGDGKAQAALLHGHIGPYPRQQVGLADDLVGAGHQRNEDVERAGAELYRDAFPGEKALVHDQAKRPERDHVPRRW